MAGSVTIKSKSDSQGKQIVFIIDYMIDDKSHSFASRIVSDSWRYHFVPQNLLSLREYTSCCFIILLKLHQSWSIPRNIDDLRDDTSD